MWLSPDWPLGLGLSTWAGAGTGAGAGAEAGTKAGVGTRAEYKDKGGGAILCQGFQIYFFYWLITSF